MSDLTRRTAIAAGLSSLAWPRLAAGSDGPAPIAVTRQGKVAGLRRNGASVFLGIPYGAPTGGARRFLPPAPPAAWSGLRDATRLGQRAPQPPGRIYESALIGPYMAGGRQQELIAMDEPEGEDCLVLNVLSPAMDRGRRPVMFYIHGGGYTSGSGAVMSLGDTLVVEQDVVLVTVNHRLGALGFLYLGGLSDGFSVGNPGMLDIVAALHWVRDNIAAFGGDPANVTLFGESGGAAKIALLLSMSQASGLFHRAILESGLVPKPVPLADARALTAKAAAALGGGPDGLAALTTRSPREIVAAAPAAAPVADERTLHPDPWRGAPAIAAEIPIIIGYCADEATLFAGLPDPATFSLDWSALRGKLAARVPLSDQGLDRVIQAYRAARPELDASSIYFRIVSDGMFARGMIGMADLKARQPAPVFLYRMNFDTRLPPGLAAFHTAELPLTARLVLEPRSDALSQCLSGAWASFARTGRPQATGVPAWPEHRAASPSIMMFDERSTFAPDPEASAQRLLFAALGESEVAILPTPSRSGKAN